MFQAHPDRRKDICECVGLRVSIHGTNDALLDPTLIETLDIHALMLRILVAGMLFATFVASQCASVPFAEKKLSGLEIQVIFVN